MASVLEDALIALSLPHDKRARIWFQSPEEFVSQPFSSRAIQVTSKARLETSRKIAVLEMFVPGGGRFGYGLLGATVVGAGQTEDAITVDIPVTGSSGPIFHGSLAGSLDVVRWGLPAEYADAVAAGTRESLTATGAPAAVGIQFTWAAHAFVGSSSHLFRRLAVLVTRLLVAPAESDLKDLVEHA